jgi:hypothetical protein
VHRSRRHPGKETNDELTVLSAPGCPNAPELERRLATVLAGRPQQISSCSPEQPHRQNAQFGAAWITLRRAALTRHIGGYARALSHIGSHAM